MAPTVADLVKFYADAPPPKKDSLADLEAHLDALRNPGYRNPVQSKPRSLKPPGVGPYEALGTYASVAEALKPPAINVPSPYQAHHTTGLVLPEPTRLSEMLARKYGQSPALTGAAKFLYDAGETLNRTMEAWRPQLEKFGMFVGGLATTIENALYVLRSAGPRDPYGNPVPLHNAGLYVLAQGAYRGDWEAEAQFLNEIGADGALDSDLYLQELLRPTFAPARLDLRVSWEQRDPRAARRWLKKRLGEIKRGDEGKTRLLLPHEGGDEQAQTELLAFADAEAARARDAEIRSILPERQYQILMLLAEERKQVEIAEELGIGISTVKTHAGRLRNNPDLRKALRP